MKFRRSTFAFIASRIAFVVGGFDFQPRDKEFFALLRPRETEKDLLRVGPNADGGYLLPDDLENVGYLFSPGVGHDTSFEEQMAASGLQTFMIDGNVRDLVRDFPNGHFRSVFLGEFDDPKARTVSLAGWVDQTIGQSTADAILQMDIEGDEWRILERAPARILSKFRILVVEFHGLHWLRWTKFRKLAFSVLTKLNAEFVPIHCHLNNNYPRFARRARVRNLEVTFIRRDRVGKIGGFAELPHALDYPSRKEVPDMDPNVFFRQQP